MKLILRVVIQPIDCISLRAMARAANTSHTTVAAAAKRGEFDTLKFEGERETWVRDEDAAIWIAERRYKSDQARAAKRKRPSK